MFESIIILLRFKKKVFRQIVLSMFNYELLQIFKVCLSPSEITYVYFRCNTVCIFEFIRMISVQCINMYICFVNLCDLSNFSTKWPWSINWVFRFNQISLFFNFIHGSLESSDYSVWLVPTTHPGTMCLLEKKYKIKKKLT